MLSALGMISRQRGVERWGRGRCSPSPSPPSPARLRLTSHVLMIATRTPPRSRFPKHLCNPSAFLSPPTPHPLQFKGVDQEFGTMMVDGEVRRGYRVKVSQAQGEGAGMWQCRGMECRRRRAEARGGSGAGGGGQAGRSRGRLGKKVARREGRGAGVGGWVGERRGWGGARRCGGGEGVTGVDRMRGV